MIGPGKPVDTGRYFVVCANLLGGCKGTTGPSSTDPATGRPYGLRFPHFSMSDLVDVHRAHCCGTSASRAWAASAGRSAGCRCCSGRSTIPARSTRPCSCAPRPADGAEHRALRGRAGVAIQKDDRGLPAGGDYYGTGREPRLGLSLASHARAHHVPLGGGAAHEVRSRTARRRHPHLRHRLRDRELPRAPGPEVPRAVRRQQLPLPLAGHGLLSTRSATASRPCGACRPSAPASSCSRSTRTGASTRRTRATSCARSRPSACPSPSARSPRRTGTTRSSSTCPSTSRRSRRSCAGWRRRPSAA